jgi:hypothetical protein
MVILRNRCRNSERVASIDLVRLQRSQDAAQVVQRDRADDENRIRERPLPSKNRTMETICGSGCAISSAFSALHFASSIARPPATSLENLNDVRTARRRT